MIGQHNKVELMTMTEVDKDELIAELHKELERCRELRAKLEVQSMRAMDQLRAQIRALGTEPVL